MKRLIAVAALMATGSATAAEDVCSLQLQKLTDQAAITKPASVTGPSSEVNQLIAEAKAYKAKGDLDNCARSGQKALTLIKQTSGGSATQ
jgi:hypothetical protein